jgi:UrcA family protein
MNRIVLKLVPLVTAGLITAAASTTARAGEDAARSVRVGFALADVSTPQGWEVFEHRVHGAARDVCDELPGYGSAASVAFERRCRFAASRDALLVVRERVAAHQAESSQRAIAAEVED